MPNFIRAANPIWFFVDLVGQPLNDTYYFSVLSNTFPYLPQFVFQDNQGINVWSDPIQFLPNGTLPDNIFWPDNEIWRLEIRQGQTQADPLIYIINNFDPGNSGSSPVDTNGGTMDNQISNPQFAFVNFPITITTPSSTTPTLTLTTAGTYHIAPGWDLILAGTGSCVVTQLIFTGQENLYQPSVPTQPNSAPPYALRINTSGGWSSVILQQQFNGVGAIWYNNFVSASMFARSEDSIPHPISINYVPNTGGGAAPIPIISSVPLVTTSAFDIIQGIVPLNSSANSTLNNAAYVDIQIVLPIIGIVDISDVQIMGQTSLLPNNFAVTPEEPLERQTDHLFHYYANELIIKPKNSILVGWNFSINPWQFNVLGATPISVTAQCSYITDQTILYQNAASQVTFFQNVGNSSGTPYNDLAIQAVAAAADTRIALIQYVDPNSVMDYWNAIVSSLARAYIVLGAGNSTKVRLKMRLIWRANLPSTIGVAEPILTWTANTDPVFSAGWTAIAPINDPAYILPSTLLANNEIPYMAFDQFQLPAQATLAQTLGIVVYTMDQMSSVAAHLDTIIFDKISLVPNAFAVDTHPQTFDQCLRECQFYYEKSYPYGIPVNASATNAGAQSAAMRIAITDDASLVLSSFSFQFKQTKRAVPVLSFWSPSSTSSGLIQYGILKNGVFNPAAANITSTTWSAASLTASGAYMLCQDTTTTRAVAPASIGNEGIIVYQYEAKARLGD